jgi:hypothetical protein
MVGDPGGQLLAVRHRDHGCAFTGSSKEWTPRMTFVDFLALLLATGAPINAWMHPDGLFEGVRQRAIVLRRGEFSYSLLGQLLTCRFCLSYHAAGLLALLFFVPGLFLWEPWTTLLKMPVYVLAAARGSFWFSRVLCPGVPEENGEEDERLKVP